ncbi:alpha-ribazole phosphatase family protein [Azoarcus olearius]|uniref:Alpha-ribazole phosphatase n=1 Tax=Azoarcus sp. (strain BH72) TaxID=418699 RepID=A1KBH2_AZOSB|nr:alpha-ribazole phosphatase family protein [Azoarcus olearius]ANQ86722.1 putative alpha-ribazole phosphatase [Azoarcus olearius]CAL96178.1 putative alpha-ribazole phosphatase [Azoarcus olearius]
MELHLIRHPRPDVPAGVCYGQRDVGLAEPAATVAARLRPLLPPQFELHASPLARARLLAEALGEPRLDARLKEIHFGEWEGQLFAELGGALDEWATDPLGFRAPGGESAREMSIRVLHWLDALLASAPPRPVVVVAHGGPLRAIAGHLLGLPAERWLGLDFECGHVTRLDVENWGVVLKWFNR